MTEIFWKIFLFLAGSAVGSFLNVIIYRVPRNISIIYPPSHCPQCGNSIRWFDNIPLVSYLLLKGKCRYCKAKISFRYFLVEMVTAFLFLILFSKYHFTLYFFIYLFLSLDLIIVSFIDWEHYIIPDIFTLTLIPLGLILSFFFPSLYGPGLTSSKGLYTSFLGGVAGFFSLLFIGLLGRVLFHKESMGGGDLKLLAGIGCFTGIKGVFLTIFISSLTGALAGGILLAMKIKKKGEYIPYGPFLSLGALLYILWGEWIKRFFLF